MKIGCFGFAKDIDIIAEAGFDSAELNIVELAGMTEEDFAAFKARASKTGLGFEAFSGCMPLSERIHDPAFDWAHWMAHFQKGAARTAEMGCTLWPFGAGKCRSIPDDSRDLPGDRERVRQFVRELCGILRPYGIRLVVEPLGPANSNYLQTIGETVSFVKTVEADNCFVMCDLRHMDKTGDPLEAIQQNIDYIKHAHIDYPNGDARLFPNGEDGYDYRPYIQTLLDAGYDGLLTIEATEYRDLLVDSQKSLALFRDYGIV